MHGTDDEAESHGTDSVVRMGNVIETGETDDTDGINGNHVKAEDDQDNNL